MIGLVESLNLLEVGKKYELYTVYLEIPVKTSSILKWKDIKEKFLAFDWKEIQFKAAFDPKEKVFVKLNQRDFLECAIFSNLRDELVLIAEKTLEEAYFLKRSSIRVTPSTKKPIKMVICLEEEKQEFCSKEITVKDISETGAALEFSKKENEDFYKKLLMYANKNLEIPLFVDIYGIDAKPLKGTSFIKNIMEKEDTIRIGILLNVDRNDIKKLRSYIMNHQQEIIQELKYL